MTTLNIRADASTDMGSGHIMRCIALGQSFMAQGGNVNFITRCQSPKLLSRLKREGFGLFDLSSEASDSNGLIQTLHILSTGSQCAGHSPSTDWVVTDGYHFDEDVHRHIKGAGHKLLVIDDFNHLPYYHADMILNQNDEKKELHYCTDPETIQLQGFKYAMIRDEFINFPPSPRFDGDTARIVVTMGGSDPGNASVKVIQALGALETFDVQSKIVIGPSSPHASEIESFAKSLRGIEVIKNANMVELMTWADLAIAAAGSTCLELCYLGVPAIIVQTAENQKNLANCLDSRKAAVYLGKMSDLGPSRIANAVTDLLKNEHRRVEMKHTAKALVDGKGAQRIIRHMKELN